MPLRVYVSSTFQDMKEPRRVVIEALRAQGCDPVFMEAEPAEDGPPVHPSTELIETCDAYLLVLGWRYGSVPAGQQLSYVELEYGQAQALGRYTIALLFGGPQDTGNSDYVGRTEDGGRRILEFRRRVEQEHTCKSFTLVTQLSAIVEDAVARLRARRERAADGKVVSPRLHPEPVQAYLERLLDGKEAEDEQLVELAAYTTETISTPTDWVGQPLSEAWALAEGDGPIAEQERPVEIDDLQRAFELHQGRFVLLGEPGAGKSKALEVFVRRAARRALQDPGPAIPLHVELDKWPDNLPDLQSLLLDRQQREGLQPPQPASRLQLFLDGLNQISPGRREACLHSIQEWLQRNPRTSVVVTSRPRDYRKGQRLSLPTVTIRPLDDPRIRAVVAKHIQDPDQQCTFLERIGLDGDDELARRRILPMARNPFNLNRMFEVYERKGTDALASRGALLRESVATLHERERRRAVSRHALVPPLTETITAFAGLAMKMIQTRSATSVSIDWVRDNLPDGLTPQPLLQLATDAGFVSLTHEDQYFRFQHQVYLDYFAAEYLVKHTDELQWCLQAPGFEPSGQRLPRPIDEAVVMVMDLADPATVVKYVTATDPFLCVECLAQLPAGVELPASATEPLVLRLVSELDGTTFAARQAAVMGLAQLGDVGVGTLAAKLRGGDYFIKRQAVEALGRIATIEALNALLDAILDKARWVRRTARQYLYALDENGRSSLRDAIRRHRRSRKLQRRQEIARALAELWRGRDLELIGLLEEMGELSLDEFRAPVELVDLPALSEGDGDPVTEGLKPAGTSKAVRAEEEARESNEREVAESWAASWLDSWRVGPRNDALAQQARTWLRSVSLETPSWSRVWGALWSAYPGDEELTLRGRAWVMAAGSRAGGWGSVVPVLVRAAPDDAALASRALGWLSENTFGSAGWGAVWVELWAAHYERPRLAGFARLWLADENNRSELWPIVWSRMWAAHPSDLDLDQWGRRWLEHGSPSHLAWAYVLEALMGAAPRDLDLLRVAIAWLESNGEHREWGRVWQRLWRRRGDNQDLLRIGRTWLTVGSQDREGWSRVWLELWNATGHDPDIERLAWDWMRTASDWTYGWGFVWPALWEAHPANRELESIARRWLGAVGIEHPSWSWVWHAILESIPRDEALQSQGWTALRTLPPQENVWPIAWSGLWDASPGRHPDLVHLGLEWLDAAESGNPAWAHVWTRLFDHCEESQRADLLANAFSWLAIERPSRRGWVYVWCETFKATSDPSIEPAARDWLAREGRNDDDWGRVWKALWQARTGEPALREQALNWLTGGADTHRSWADVWLALWESSTDTNQLARIAILWLRSSPKGQYGWSNVWRAMQQFRPRDAALRALAIDWLGDVSPRYSGWYPTWRTVVSDGLPTPALDEASCRWLRAQSAPTTPWLHVANWLDGRGALPDDLARMRGTVLVAPGENSGERVRAELARLREDTEDWGERWQALLQAGADQHVLGELAATWLRLEHARLKCWPFVWKGASQLEVPSAGLTSVGESWVQARPRRASGWGLVWQIVARRPGAPAAVIDLGWEWLKPEYFKRSSWPAIWLVLWDVGAPERRPELVDAAVAWLPRHGLGGEPAERSPEIWERVRRLRTEDTRLDDWAIQFLAVRAPSPEPGNEKRDAAWWAVVSRLAESPRSRSLLLVQLREWLEANAGHRLSTRVEEFLLRATSGA